MTVIADVIAVSDDCVAVIGGSRTEVGNFPLRCEKHSENSKKKRQGQVICVMITKLFTI